MKYKPNEEKLENVIQEVIVEAVKIEPEEVTNCSESDDKAKKILIKNINKQISLAKLAIKSLEEYVFALTENFENDD